MAVIEAGLTAYNDGFGVADDSAPALRSSCTTPWARVIGGATGRTDRGWLYLDCLWLPEDLRKGGLGGARCSGAAEAEAWARGCRRARLFTYSFQARGFYERHGYAVFGVLEDYPPGHSQVGAGRRPWRDDHEMRLDQLRARPPQTSASTRQSRLELVPVHPGPARDPPVLRATVEVGSVSARPRRGAPRRSWRRRPGAGPNAAGPCGCRAASCRCALVLRRRQLAAPPSAGSARRSRRSACRISCPSPPCSHWTRWLSSVFSPS